MLSADLVMVERVEKGYLYLQFRIGLRDRQELIMCQQSQIRCDDGTAYETYMGLWSHKEGEDFLSWFNQSGGPLVAQRRGRAASNALGVRQCRSGPRAGLSLADIEIVQTAL